MCCEICASDICADSVLWTCAGCPRKFHAACVGVSTLRSTLRRKDRKVEDSTSYILPCCSSCQELITAKLEVTQLYDQQKLLTEQLHQNTEIVHKLNLHQKKHIVDEAFEGLEILMTAIKNELAAINKTSSLAGSVSAIKNHITTVVDVVAKKTNESITNSLQSVTTGISTELRSINNDLCQINQRQLDMAASSAMSSNPNLFVDVVDELKTWSAQIINSKNTEYSPASLESYSSLEAELSNVLSSKKTDSSKITPKTNDGWRYLGTRKVWKADWSQYDAKLLRREEQEKNAEKARKRKKLNKNKLSTQSNRTRNSNAEKRHSNKNSININNNRNNSSNRNTFCRPEMQSSSSRGFNNQQCKRVTWGANAGRNSLSPDGKLLAAGKELFSGLSSASYRPSIQFHRGEVLNPLTTNGRSVPTSPATASTSRMDGSCCCQCFCRN